MDISQLMCFCILFRKQVFICIIFGNFRSKSHHLSGRSMARHIGIAQIDIILVDGNDTIHDVFDLRFPVAFRISPLAIDDVFLGYFRLNLHQFCFHEVLDSLDCNGRFSKVFDDTLRDFINHCFLMFQASSNKCFTNGIGYFGG